MEAEPPPNLGIFILYTLLSIQLWNVLLPVLLLITLIGLSAMISGSEVAFFSISPNDLEELKEEETKESDRILQLKEKPQHLLATILISNNFVNIAIVIVADYLLRQILPAGFYSDWSQSIIDTMGLSIGMETLGRIINFVITVGLVTFLLVLLGEILPKIYAQFHNLSFARTTVTPVSYLTAFLLPLSNRMVQWSDRMEARLDANPSATNKEELDRAIELAVSDSNDTEEKDILKGLVKFGEVATKQIMKSRVDVIAVEEMQSFDELMEIVRTSGYSRLPVYKEDFDNIAGILYVKDLLGYYEEKRSFNWQSLIRTNVLYVPESKKIDELLKSFQRERMHLAIVVDEYGGSSGIVTLEDIMEEVVGDIKDEFDDQKEVEYHKIDDYNYVFEGKTLLNDVCRIIGEDTEIFDDLKGEADSIAGLILESLGQIPKEDQEILMDRFKFKIVASNPRRIEKVHITINPQ